jgi:DnaJ-class molecular chaperone
MKTDKELADDLDAKKRLEGHGYTQKKCPQCRGTGFIPKSNGGYHCYSCEGKGYTWEAPFMQHINHQ